MKEPKKFDFILSFSMFFIVLSNLGFGMLAFLLFDTQTASPITNALCKPFYHVVEIAAVALCGDLLFTFTIVFVACRDVVESALFDKSDFRNVTHAKRCAVRSGMIGVCGVVAVVGQDKFGPIIGECACASNWLTCARIRFDIWRVICRLLHFATSSVFACVGGCITVRMLSHIIRVVVEA
jgi:hypothetical protein